MNKRLKALSCALVAIFALSIAVDSPKLGPFGVDAVSAATGAAPAKPTTPSKPSTPGKTNNNYTSPTNSTTTSTGVVTRLLKLNSTGNDVKLVQANLNKYGNKLTVDGMFGNLTVVAVKSFQKWSGLTVDGLCGPATLAKLIPAPVIEARLLKLGSVGDDVTLLQTNLNKYGNKLTVDGIFGNLTVVAVKTFQKWSGLAADGLCGPATFEKLNPKPVTPAKPVTPTKPVTPPVVVVPPVVDVVTAASLVDTAAVFEKSIGKDGKWIITTTKDLVTTNELVLDGEFKNGKKDAVTGADLIQRKIGLYTQDDKRVVTARFTLTAPKLTIKSPMSSLEYGTLKGDLYVTSANFKLIDATVVGNVYVSATNFTMTKNAKIQGNVYFSTQGAKDTFKPEATTTVTGTKDLIVVDAVTTASIVDNATAFQKAISKDGTWIIPTLKDLTIDKDLVLDGKFLNGKKDAAGVALYQRKIALYTQAPQDGKNTVTNRFTLTAPKLTILSPVARIQGGTFKGDVYVKSDNFLLTDAKIAGNVYVSAPGFNLTTNAKVEGNVYFSTQAIKDTFKTDDTSSVTGTKEVILVDAVTTASLVDNATDLAKAIGTNGRWIICATKDISTDKDLVLEGAYYNEKVDAVTGVALLQRKIGLYTQDDKRVVTARFTLTAPKLTITSPMASLEHGTFKGDIYVSAIGFKLVDAKIVGNVYFTTQAAKDTFKALDATTTISGVQALKLN